MVEKTNNYQTHFNDVGELIVHSPTFVSSYNDKIRPVLDAVDNLRRLNVVEEGITLPTIVVVGDQSSGKSSVLASLAGVNLPSGDGTTTRVPLIIRLQHHPDPVPEIHLEFRGKEVRIWNERRICDAINQVMVEIAGTGKGISNVPLTLVVKKKDVPDLTLVDLPGIARVPVDDQPKDIYEQISGIIMEYIKPEESIIVNVLSADANFTICESIRLSREVDDTGQRTLGVVTKCDLHPKGVLEKIIANDVNIRLGYICVRNRVENETYDEARMQETTLFKTHPLLSKINKSMVGIPMLARRLIEIQSTMISKRLPGFIEKINKRLDSSVSEFNKLRRVPTTVADAMADFMQMVGSLKDTLQTILVRGEFDKYTDDKQMHFNARLVEMLDEFSKELNSSVGFSDNFLVDEMHVLEDAKGIRLPCFLPHSAFRFLLEKRVNGISELRVSFINKAWGHLETVCVRVFIDHCGNYPQLLPSMMKAAHNAMAKTKAKFMERVVEMIEMEKVTDYTCDPNYNGSLQKLMGAHDSFVNAIRGGRSLEISVEGHGTVDIKHLVGVAENVRDQAFELKMRMTAYWEIVTKRMVDWIALRLWFTIRQMLNTEMQTEIVNEVMVNAHGLQKMTEEPSSIAIRRERLRKNIELLQESKRVIDGSLLMGY